MKKVRLKIRDFLTVREGVPKIGHVFYWMRVNNLKVVCEH